MAARGGQSGDLAAQHGLRLGVRLSRLGSARSSSAACARRPRAVRVELHSRAIPSSAIRRLPSKAVTVYNGVDGDRCSARRRSATTIAHDVCMSAASKSAKAFTCCVDAFERVICQRVPNARLRIVGPHSYWERGRRRYYRHAGRRDAPPIRASNCAGRPTTIGARRRSIASATCQRRAVGVSGGAWLDVARSAGVRRSRGGVGRRRIAGDGLARDAAASSSRTATPSSWRAGASICSAIPIGAARWAPRPREWVMATFSWDVIAARARSGPYNEAVRGMKVALRDDDTSYFTEPDALEAVYHDVWDRMPVCLAVVPHAAGFADKAIPEKYWHAGRAFPLERMRALVASLRELAAGRPRHDRAARLHARGLSGRPRIPGGAGPRERGSRADRRISSGCSTRAIRVFVPPHNALSKRGLAAVTRPGLNLLGSFLSFRPSMRPWDAAHARQLVAHRALSRARPAATKADRMIYPHVLRYRHHAEFGCHSLIPGTTFEELVARLRRGARGRRRFLPRDALLGSRRDAEETCCCGSSITRRGVPDVEFVAVERLFDCN